MDPCGAQGGSLLAGTDSEEEAAATADSSSEEEGAALAGEEEYEMTMQFKGHLVEDTRRTTQLQAQKALSAYPEEQTQEQGEESEESEAEEDATVFLSIDEHKAASERERQREAEKETQRDTEDPFGFEEAEEDEQRTSLRRSSHRQSMCFRPSCGRGRGSSGGEYDNDEPMGGGGAE